LVAHDDEPPGKPECAWDDLGAKQALVSGLVNDALALLAAVADPGLDAEQAEAVALLALVAGQDVEPGERPGSWRIARKVAKDRVISTVDPQARHTRKTSAQRRDGDKGHIAGEPESGLVTECVLTAANLPDGPTGVRLLADEDPDLEVLGDTGDGAGATRAALRAAGWECQPDGGRRDAWCRGGVELLQPLEPGEVGLQGAADAAALGALVDLGCQDLGQEAAVRQPFAGGVVGDPRVLGGDGGQVELPAGDPDGGLGGLLGHGLDGDRHGPTP
jgi:hypothetical protein